MADPKDGESFFRKVVRFVANPATDWTDLNTRQEDTRDLEIEKSELKAMIERKRRNDFVRKREFDMLRKVRREGLSPEQLAALGGSSRLDDSEARLPDSRTARADSGVKQKIDEIEQQMVGDGGFHSTSRRPPGFMASGSARLASAAAPPAGAAATRASQRPAVPRGLAPSSGQLGLQSGFAGQADVLPALPPLRADMPDLPDIDLPPAAAPAPMQMAARLPPLAPMQPMSFGPAPVAGAGIDGDSDGAFSVDISEVVHDPELDEAVIAFANADFGPCEEALQQITAAGGARAQHAETWLVLFDLYRATGQQQRFESLALDYARQFGWSAPQWYSLPKLVADAVADERPAGSRQGGAGAQIVGDVGWTCPAVLDIDAVGRLRSQTLQMPLPWIFDWALLRSVDAEAAMQLSMVFRLWAGQALEMRWIAGDRLFQVLADAAPTGVRDADPAYWLTRLDALRLANRADQFDETAIDYCVTYEVSPPSWEPARCRVRISGSGLSTRTPPLSMVSDVSTSFMESGLADESVGQIEQAHVELSGQLVGDIGPVLARLDLDLRDSPIVSVSCARLIRVDFIAAGDLLNWVLSKRTESRAVQFVDAHRLVALFFGAMGINEHAKVQVRKV